MEFARIPLARGILANSIPFHSIPGITETQPGNIVVPRALSASPASPDGGQSHFDRASDLELDYK